MSDPQAWIIGAAPECDVIVDEATVSGRHCQLTYSDDGFLLEDLGSTNGTFVNGTRLTAPLSVSAADEIKLGPAAVFPWNAVESMAAGSRVIRIGRLPDNDIVLDYPNVSGHHARIIVEDGLTTIEDLGSTNGVAIGKPNNKITTAVLTGTDTVYFGSMWVLAADLMDPKRTAAGPEITVNMLPTGGGWLRSRRSMVIAAGTVVTLVIVVGVAASFFRGDRDTTGDPKISSNGSSDGSSDNSDNLTTTKPPTVDDLYGAIYSVLVQDKKNDQLFRIGTAWAVSQHQLVTSASVTKVIEELHNDFPIVQVRCAALEKVFIVSGWDTHGGFERAMQEAKSAGRKAKSKREELEKLDLKSSSSTKKPPTKEAVDKLVEQLFQYEEDRFLAMSRQSFFDVGLLTVEETLPKVLAASMSADKLAVQSSLTLYGVAFEHDQSAFFDPIKPSQLEGRLIRMVRPQNNPDESLEHLLVSSPANHHKQNWLGSPVLNAEGQVVAVYSRATPPVAPNKPMTGTTFDATAVGHIRTLPVVMPEIRK